MKAEHGLVGPDWSGQTHPDPERGPEDIPYGILP